MKTRYYFLVVIAFASVLVSCEKAGFKKTKSGLVYKIIPGNSKDSVAKPGNFIKIHFQQKLNDDSVLQTSYGKQPYYEQVMVSAPDAPYNPAEIFHLLRKGDSGVVVMFVDSLVNKKLINELPPFLKKGDKLTLNFKVVDVFRNDSAYRADEMAEYKINQPAIEKDRAEQMARQKKMMEEEQENQLAELEKSGQGAQERKVVEDYLAKKNIKAEKVGKGTYVSFTERGNGPKAEIGKYVSVKYSGRRLVNDSTFESNVYPLHLGVDPVIAGWVEGLQQFREGDKGTLYIPGYLGYGSNPRPGSPFGPNEALIFDIEMQKVSDTPPTQ